MKALLISGDTLQEWNVNDILDKRVNQSNKDIIEKLEFQEIYNKRKEWYYNHRLALLEQLNQI